jgi:uncharacterized protein (TIGR03083 family)
MQLSPIYDGAPILSIDGVGDPSSLLLRQRRRLLKLLGALTDEEWAAPSRCAQWSVKDVVSHLVSTDQFWAISLPSARQGEPTRFLATFDPVASPAQLVDRMRDASPAEVLAQYTTHAGAFLEVVTSVSPDEWSLPAEAPPGHLAMNVTALHALWDAWIHERDIVIPLGKAPTEDPDETAAILAYAAALSPAFYVARGTGERGTLAVEATDPAVVFTVEVGDTVVVRRGAAPDGPRLVGRAVDLIEGLSHRAPLAHSFTEGDMWLLAGLNEVFDVA